MQKKDKRIASSEVAQGDAHCFTRRAHVARAGCRESGWEFTYGSPVTGVSSSATVAETLTLTQVVDPKIVSGILAASYPSTPDHMIGTKRDSCAMTWCCSLRIPPPLPPPSSPPPPSKASAMPNAPLRSWKNEGMPPPEGPSKSELHGNGNGVSTGDDGVDKPTCSSLLMSWAGSRLCGDSAGRFGADIDARWNAALFRSG